EPNVESTGQTGFALGTIEISPDARIAAIPIDVGGGERYTVRFRDLTADAYLPVEIADTNGQVAWAADSATVFFARADAKNRPSKVLRRSIVSPDPERLVFEEPDEAFLVDLASSRSGAFVLINSAAKDTSECRVISTSNPEVEPRVIEPRRRGVEYSVDHQAGEFVILVNDTGANFRLIRTPQDATTSSNWREIIAHDPRTLLEKVECFRGFVAVT
ncbi:MAG: oligopeptidase B, partial [Phycisphaerae bacterium]